MARGPGLAVGLLAAALLLIGGAGGASLPAGGLIAFTSDRNGSPDVFVTRADGSGQRRLTNNPADDSDPAWQPAPGRRR